MLFSILSPCYKYNRYEGQENVKDGGFDEMCKFLILLIIIILLIIVWYTPHILISAVSIRPNDRFYDQLGPNK